MSGLRLPRSGGRRESLATAGGHLEGGRTFSVLVDALNLPTSLDFVGDTAFVVTLNGEVWRIEGV